MEKLKSELAQLLEVDSVEMDQELATFECWDSLTILSIIALAGENYNVTLKAVEISNAKTVEGLCNLINVKSE